MEILKDENNLHGIKSWLDGNVRSFMGFEHAFFSEMIEKLPSWDELQKHVDELRVLSDSFEIHLRQTKLTMNGWFIELRILYSFEMWSTCCDFISYSFFMIFTHRYFDVFFFFTSLTFPKEPTIVSTITFAQDRQKLVILNADLPFVRLLFFLFHALFKIFYSLINSSMVY